MIKEIQPITLIETKKSIEENNGREDILPYLKKFIKVKIKDCEQMKKELKELNNHKLKEDYIVKIIDFLPEDASDLNKIFIDVSLDEDEIKQITGIVAKYK